MFLSEQEYQHVLDLMEGRIVPGPLLKELAEWTGERFGVKVYDYICDQTTNGLTRLRVVVWDREVHDVFMDAGNYNKSIQMQFQEEFAFLARKYMVHPEYYDAEKIFVCWETVKDQIVSKELWLSRMEFFNLKLSRNDIWKIEIIFQSVHVFYETDDQVETHASDGVSEGLRRQISDIMRSADRYGVFKDGVSCVFTSHQTLNEKYRGSMFYYTR